MKDLGKYAWDIPTLERYIDGELAEEYMNVICLWKELKWENMNLVRFRVADEPTRKR